MNKRILGGLLCAAMLCAAPALTMPGMGEGKAPVDKFPMMDANKDGSVSKEEFKKFFPRCRTAPLPPSTRTRTAPSAMRNGRASARATPWAAPVIPTPRCLPPARLRPRPCRWSRRLPSNRRGERPRVPAGRSPFHGTTVPPFRPFTPSGVAPQGRQRKTMPFFPKPRRRPAPADTDISTTDAAPRPFRPRPATGTQPADRPRFQREERNEFSFRDDRPRREDRPRDGRRPAGAFPHAGRPRTAAMPAPAPGPATRRSRTRGWTDSPASCP